MLNGNSSAYVTWALTPALDLNYTKVMLRYSMCSHVLLQTMCLSMFKCWGPNVFEFILWIMCHHIPTAIIKFFTRLTFIWWSSHHLCLLALYSHIVKANVNQLLVWRIARSPKWRWPVFLVFLFLAVNIFNWAPFIIPCIDWISCWILNSGWFALLVSILDLNQLGCSKSRKIFCVYVF